MEERRGVGSQSRSGDVNVTSTESVEMRGRNWVERVDEVKKVEGVERVEGVKGVKGEEG